MTDTLFEIFVLVLLGLSSVMLVLLLILAMLLVANCIHEQWREWKE